MSLALPILLLAAFAVVAWTLSLAVGLGLPGLDRMAEALPARHRSRLWLGVAALPAVLAAVAVLVTLLPALGLGSDHCLAHDPHHPHLCPHHVGGMPALVLVALAALIVVRYGLALGRFVRATHLSRAASRALDGSTRRDRFLRVIDTSEPRAFVLGILAPVVHVSRGMLALGEDVVGPVLAHEHAHARARHTLWRSLFPLLAAAHLPGVASCLGRRLSTAQEMAADAQAARETGDPEGVAHALIRLARSRLEPTPALPFVHGDLGARVRALLAPEPPARPGCLLALWVPTPAAIVTLAVLREDVHHLLETVLGALS